MDHDFELSIVDDGMIWVQCSCGWGADLGFNPHLHDVNFFVINHIRDVRN